MRLVEWILGRRDSKLIKRYVDRLVDRCTAAVRTATLARIAGMPKAEARGYVRATAVAVVRDAIDRAARSGEAIAAKLSDVVLTLSVEQIVVTVTAAASTGRPMQSPRRKAA